jgi:hypothetical protein
VDHVVTLLLFSNDDPTVVASPSPYYRVRDPSADRVVLAALDRLVDLAERGTVPSGAGRQRFVDAQTQQQAENNLLFAVRTLCGKAPSAADVLRHAPHFRRLFTCPLPEDDDETRARKERVLTALHQQFPVVLAVGAEGLDARLDPSYPWSPERRVADRIGFERVRFAMVPETRREEVARMVSEAGHRAIEILAIEDFELLRIVAETPND